MQGNWSKNNKWSLGLLFLSALFVLPQAASAQQDINNPVEAVTPEQQSVLQRPRPEYDPLGAYVGSFIFLPSITTSETYDSNVYATKSNVKSDFFTTIKPAFDLQSDWGRHALNFQLNTETKRYAEQVSENLTNIQAAAQGRLDIQHGEYLTAAGSYLLSHEDRASPDATSTKKPVEFHVTNGSLGYVHEQGVVGARLNLGAASYDYNNATSGNGTTVIENDRDRIEYKATPRATYEIAEGYHAFVQGSVNSREYASQFDAAGFQRSSKGYEVDAGTAIEIGIINGEIFAGYFDQSYDDARFSDSKGPGLGTNLLWNVTRLTSLRLAASRTVEETTIQSASSSIQSAIALSAEHELLRNVLLTGLVSYTNLDYQGIVRSDKTYEANAGVKYLITRNLYAGFNMIYRQRETDAVGQDYDRYLAIASLRLQY